MGAKKIADQSGFDVLFYANPQPMWIYDVQSLQILEVNTAAVNKYGYSHDEFLTKTIEQLRPTEDVALLRELLPSITGHQTNTHELRHLSKNGEILFTEVISYSMTYNGVPARMVYARSIDERHELAGQLQLTQRRLLQILETTVIGFLQLGFDWKITYWNNAAESLIGYRREDVMGRNFWDVLPEIQHSDFYTHFQRTMTGRESIDFIDYFWPTQKWFACNAYPAEDGIMVHFRDITHKKKAEEGLLEKIDQLREVSFLNSHAVRKPIASLLGLTNLVKQELIKPEEFRDVAMLIHNCSLELDAVVREVNNKVSEDDHTHSLRSNSEEFSFKELLKAVVTQAQTYSPKHRVISEKLEDVAFYGNKHTIERAVKYLVINAIRFSPGADKIIVNSEVINQNLVLYVQDFGKGMSEQSLENMFLELSSKEPASNISGGLQNVWTVCQQHHGSMWIESELNKGTTFMMRFPLSNIATFKATGRPDFSIYQNGYADVVHHSVDDYIEVNWKGFHNLYTIKENCFKVLQLMKETGCKSILNNNLEVLGSWDDAMDWVAKDWFPLIHQAGLQYFAWIYSPSTFGKLSASHTVALIDMQVCLKEFHVKDEALRWLLNVSKGADC
jgi:PAS domain S-box-containing protein